MMFRPWYAGVACGLVIFVVALSDGRASVYSYTDAEGVFHVTNVVRGAVPPGSMGVGSNATPSAAVPSAKVAADYDPIIREAAEYYSLPVALVKAVVAAESAFEATAVSPADAHGLMQLRPRTAAAMAVRQIHDPRENVFGGARYLRLLINQFNGNVQLALAAYNAGPAAVERAGGIPPFRETIHYVQRVLRFYLQYQ